MFCPKYRTYTHRYGKGLVIQDDTEYMGYIPVLERRRYRELLNDICQSLDHVAQCARFSEQRAFPSLTSINESCR